MKEHYKLVDDIYAYLISDEYVNTVTFGDIFDVDLAKQTIFPLAHVNINQIGFTENSMQVNIQLIAMDIVDESKEDKNDLASPHLGKDNKQDVLNSMLSVVNRFQASIRRGTSPTRQYILPEPATATVFEDRFENLLAGWSLDILLETPNDNITIVNPDTGEVESC